MKQHYDCVISLGEKYIISLTTFPARINYVYKTILSLLNQNVKPDKIVLYLSEEEFPDKKLPNNLTNLLNDSIFEIRYVPTNYKSYKKLYFALSDFPDSNIITVDDDVIYPRFLLKDLIKTHKKNPKNICAHRIRKINIKDNKIMEYKSWELSEKRKLFDKRIPSSVFNFFCGVGGVLYPAKSLYKDVFKSEVFLKYCEYQDDVWFWAMAVLNNRQISVTRFGYDCHKCAQQEVQSVGLWNTINSNSTNPNNIALEKILNLYPKIVEKLGI